MKIRVARPQDAKQIAEVHVGSWQTTYIGLVSDEFLASLNVDDRVKRWDGILANLTEDHQIWVAEDEGKIVGFANGGRNRDTEYPSYTGEVYAIYLLQAYQGQGIGAALFTRVVQELSKLQYDSMLLWVLEGNPAQLFYEKLGGVVVGEKTLEIGGKSVREFAMGWNSLQAFDRKRTQLILDAGGVLIPNFTTEFWMQFANQLGVSASEIADKFGREMKKKLWCGEITEPAFWEWLTQEYPVVDREQAQQLLLAHIKPLPTVEHLEAWSKYADIHILSNHRAEWLKPILESLPEGVIQSITISSEVGCCKPDLAIYEIVQTKLMQGEPILFVDDQERNFPHAEALGWQTVLADDESKWVEAVHSTIIST
ncbi:GNAT family N-acetyltransferase [Paenibacillus sp. N1-5-1-14]|uniref:GNAT family N-acetyltransferase n=1 Tax=Paenibacillus radicibacter TaxID=2972488 RepID=UPI002159B597|nr:GNAT family N-acetyltransferase [Paenibacillus radicibacter]MCR8645016.1 GNAT family N-acetyltransferase [Paenibacillus radicibacter]